MPNVLVIAETLGGRLDDAAWELRTAARALAGDGRIGVALLGHGLEAASAEAARGFDDVWVFDDPRLEAPDGDAWARTLVPLLAREAPWATLLAHTNLAIDAAPPLAVRAGLPLLADCLAVRAEGEGLHAVRAVYGGKVHANVTSGPSPHGYLVTVRGGAFDGAPPEADVGGTVHAEALPDDVGARRRYVRTVDAEPGAVDLTAAEVLVGVGRGIEEEENLEIVTSLAEALGGEVACSRPVVDKGWLPKSRQVGTSGITVKPRLYVAIGISGSFQHVGGIKGSPFLVAVNKDPRAPIFAVADVGIVGDLFDVVPALEEQVRAAKA